MSFDYATAEPLMDDVNTKWAEYKKFSERMGTALMKSACAPWVDAVDADKLTTEMQEAITALSDYIASLET